MEHSEIPNLYVRLLPSLETAICRWLAARREYKKQASDENQNAYNGSYFALGEAWTKQHPDAAEMPGAFEWYRRGLIAPDEE